MKGNTLDIRIEERDGIQLIQVAGPLDSETFERFKNQLDACVNRPRARVVLDCASMTYVNSRGLTLLGRYHRIASQSLSFFGVAALKPRILKAIDLLGMGGLVKPYSSIDEALRAAGEL